MQEMQEILTCWNILKIVKMEFVQQKETNVKMQESYLLPILDDQFICLLLMPWWLKELRQQQPLCCIGQISRNMPSPSSEELISLLYLSVMKKYPLFPLCYGYWYIFISHAQFFTNIGIQNKGMYTRVHCFFTVIICKPPSVPSIKCQCHLQSFPWNTVRPITYVIGGYPLSLSRPHLITLVNFTLNMDKWS